MPDTARVLADIDDALAETDFIHCGGDSPDAAQWRADGAHERDEASAVVLGFDGSLSDDGLSFIEWAAEDESWTLEPWQVDYLRALMRPQPFPRQFILSTGRQAGRTFAREHLHQTLADEAHARGETTTRPEETT